MAGRPGLDPTEEGKSYSALFVLMVALLLVVAVWSIWDDNISRRPWKEYQVEFDRLAYDKYMQDAADEQKTLDANPEYVKLIKDLAADERQLNSGETADKLASLKQELVGLKVTADEKDQAARFTKSFLTESWYDYNHAIQTRQDPTEYKNQIDQLNRNLDQETKISDDAKARFQKVKDEIDALNSQVDTVTDKLKTLTKKRDDLTDKADGYMIPVKFAGRVILRYPKIPKIQQTAIDDFDRNAFDEAIARVDRCQSCHMGIDKKGFENAKQPFRTHSNFDAIIGKHPHGQTRLHALPRRAGPGGQLDRDGARRHRALGVSPAHRRRDAVAMHQVPYRRRLAARQGRQADRDQLGRGRTPVPADGLHRMPSGGGLRRHAQDRSVSEARLAPSSIRRGPCAGLPIRILIQPHTRMPNFMFSREQATEIAAYILSMFGKEFDRMAERASRAADARS